jgi:hypothetical protein
MIHSIISNKVADTIYKEFGAEDQDVLHYMKGKGVKYWIIL